MLFTRHNVKQIFILRNMSCDWARGKLIEQQAICEDRQLKDWTGRPFTGSRNLVVKTKVLVVVLHSSRFVVDGGSTSI
jgi:hypothetical protein